MNKLNIYIYTYPQESTPPYCFAYGLVQPPKAEKSPKEG